jgi:DNA-binding winged helix-turn-helix (wHTH) protein
MANIECKSIVKISKMYSYDLQKERLLFDNEEQSLTPKQAQIMNLFANNINKIVDFDMLRHYVWDDTPVDNATIRAEVHRVRQMLKEDLVESLKGIGYKITKHY